MKRVLTIASLALVFDVVATGQQPQGVAKRYTLAGPIFSTLADAGVSGSIEYTGRCGPGVNVPDLPLITDPQKPYARDPVKSLRTMFSADSRFAVSQQSNGMIRVVGAGVETDILQVKINQLAFHWVSDPDEALHIVLSAPEVQAFMRANGIGQPFNMYIGHRYDLPLPRKPPVAGVRNVAGELNDVTVADALDYLLKTFPGFWLYQDCDLPGQRVVYFDLFPAPGRMWSWVEGMTTVVNP